MKLALPRISKSDVLEYDGEHLRFEREWEDGKRGAGPRVKQLHPEVLKLRTDAAIWFWTAREHTVEDAHAEHVRAVTEYNVDRKRRGLAPVRSCCVEWLRVEIKKLQSFQTYSAKFGQAKAHAVYKADGLGVRASRFLEIGMIDHHTFDAWVSAEPYYSLDISSPSLSFLHVR